MESWRRNQKNREIMTDIVIRALSKKEAHELRMLKLQLEERNWRTLFLRIIKEWEGTHHIVPIKIED